VRQAARLRNQAQARTTTARRNRKTEREASDCEQAVRVHFVRRYRSLSLAREYPPEQMRIVQEGFEKEDLLAAA
jgi:hypothetical protein